ncbi:MAG: MMPL family transporter [Actinomycetota bacterium]|nr:MMPL family transporter [Actinomycetota bacterium]
MSQTEIATDDTASSTARRRPGRTRGAYVVAALGVLWLLLGAAGGSYQGKLSQVQKNDQAAYLPSSAESTKVNNESQEFQPVQTIPGFIVYQRESGLTAADRAKIAADVKAIAAVPGVASDQASATQFSRDGKTASLSVPLIGKRGNVSVDGSKLVNVEKSVIQMARAGAPPGLAIHSAGPGGLLVAFIDAFSGIDGSLLLAAGIVVIGILLVVYRSPVLWIFPLFSAVLALGAAALIIYPLAKHSVLTLNGQTQGILSVLVIGAGTDYALLLISRYREELHSHESRVVAMGRAWRGAAPAIGASAATVIVGLMCLTLGELNSDRSLGPVCAIGIACTVAVMLTFLPLFLVLWGRWIFWPRVPRVDHQVDIATHGAWGRFATALSRNARRSWIITAAVLVVCVAGLSTLRSSGLATTDSFTTKPDALQGQRIFDANFSAGQGAPAVITTEVGQSAAVIAAVSKISGISTTPGSVCVAVDYGKLAALAKSGTGPTGQVDGCAPAQLQVGVVNGRTMINAQLADRYDTPQAIATVKRIRSAVAAIPAARALVGGSSAINYDTNQASRHDRDLIIPIVLAVILVVLALLLRAVVAPLLLIATVVLSFSAALGVSAVVFNHLFHFANSDPGFPLFVFIFLVALGIDYNIFLMTRVREETLKDGTREGIRRGLAVTGGVITSAGVVLAATFTVLGVLPIVALAEIGFAVAFGVLLDTFLVRSVLVPALGYDLGRRIWWPSKLAHGPA